MSAVLEVREPSARYLSATDPPLVRQFDLLARAPGGPGQLRDLILTLAVQGKLVPQDPIDEPAQLLLEEISREKDRQVAAGRIKPDKPLNSLADGHPFEIPAAWAWVPMGEIVEIVRGITFPASEKTKEAAPGRIACLRTANVQEAIEWDDLLFVNRSFVGRDDQLLRLHDIVMSMANSRELVGKVALVDHVPHDEASFGGFLGVLRPWKIEPRYAMALLRSAYARSALIDSSSQTTNIANISLGKLRPLPFPLPPLAEQARIVARVDELMRLCDALEEKGRLEAEQHARLLSTLLGTLTDSATPEELAANWQRVAEHFNLLLDRPEAIDDLEQTVLDLAMRGRLVPQDERNGRADGESRRKHDSRPAIPGNELPYEVPATWRWVRLGSVAQLINGDRGTNYPNKSEYVSSGLPFINTGHIEPDGSLSEDSMHYLTRRKFESLRSGKTRPGDLVYCLRGATLGKTAMVDFDEGAIASSLVIIRLGNEVDRRFAYFYLTGPLGRQLVKRFDNGSAQPNLAATSVQKYVLPLPPLAEQYRIVARVTELRRLCTTLRQRLQAQQATQSRLAEALVEQALAG